MTEENTDGHPDRSNAPAGDGLHQGRWKLTIEYDGGGFCGWQKQENGISVQECLEKAVHDFCGETVTVHVAGRTDSGVHATGQVAHVDLARRTDARAVRDAINYHLRPRPAVILKAEPAAADFHARFSARRRVYCYRILMDRRSPPMIDAGRVWHVSRPLDVPKMNEAARHLLGRHDFSSFRAAACQAKTPLRTLDRLEFVAHPQLAFGHHLELWAEARSFLHHQIRNMAGTLQLVGEGKWQPEDVLAALKACDRGKAGPMAPADGLYFVRVDYP